MESTALIETLAQLRANFEKPPSDMEIIRRSLAAQTARLTGTEMPPILNDDQRKVFLDKIDLMHEFLKTEDGADAIELLVNTFKHFIEERETIESEEPPVEEPVTE